LRLKAVDGIDVLDTLAEEVGIAGGWVEVRAAPGRAKYLQLPDTVTAGTGGRCRRGSALSVDAWHPYINGLLQGHIHWSG
jgi:hypothetical protein